MKLVLDWNEATSSLLDYNGKTEIKIGTGSAFWYEHGLKLFRDSDPESDSLYVGLVVDNKDATPTQGSGASLSEVNGVTSVQFTSTDYKTEDGKLILFFSYDPNADTFTLSGLKNDGLTVTHSYASHTYNVASNDYQYLQVVAGKNGDATADMNNVIESITTFDEAMGANAIKYYAQTSIPEPATATLSLLALAGLAARRRRK